MATFSDISRVSVVIMLLVTPGCLQYFYSLHEILKIKLLLLLLY